MDQNWKTRIEDKLDNISGRLLRVENKLRPLMLLLTALATGFGAFVGLTLKGCI